MDKGKLFVASCVSLVTTSMVFAIRGDAAPAMSTAFQLTNEQMGLIFSPAFWAFTVADFHQRRARGCGRHARAPRAVGHRVSGRYRRDPGGAASGVAGRIDL